MDDFFLLAGLESDGGSHIDSDPAVGQQLAQNPRNLIENANDETEQVKKQL